MAQCLLLICRPSYFVLRPSFFVLRSSSSLVLRPSRALFRRHRPDDQLATTNGGKRRIGSGDGLGNQRLHLGTGEDVGRRQPNEARLVA